MRKQLVAAGVIMQAIILRPEILGFQTPAGTSTSRKKVPSNQREPPWVNAGPRFDFDRLKTLVGWLQTVDTKLGLKFAAKAFKNRGLEYISPSQINELRGLGAPDPLLTTIKDSMPPAPLLPERNVKPTPPVERAGPLLIACDPPGCNILLKGQSEIKTTDRSMPVRDLAVGEISVEVTKAGYVEQRLSIVLKPNVAESRSVELVPTEEHQEEFGKTLLGKMITALGGEPSLSALKSIEAAGDSTVFMADGGRLPLSVIARLTDTAVRLTMKGVGVDWWVLLRDGQEPKYQHALVSRRSPRNALRIQEGAKMLQAYQLSRVVQKIRSPAVRARALGGDPNDPRYRVLTFSTEVETFKINLTKDALPIQIEHSSASGLEREVVFYSDYLQVSTTRYPATIDVKFSDSTKEGIQFHFTRVEGKNFASSDLSK